ncbi:MAG TPA: hypothetical protein VGY55_11775 [Pirellulales bacterium]|nr:hypothetical protein [Pirellulales bacterium]
MPNLIITISMPQRMENLIKRDHNRIAKEALRAVLEEHHKKRIPEHFKPYAHAKYGYRNRTTKYRSLKARLGLGDVDLVLTGATEAEMTRNAEITMSGAAEGAQKSLGGTMTLKFPFGSKMQASYAKKSRSYTGGGPKRYGEQPKRGGVNLEEMRREIQFIRDDEAKQMAKQFLAEYMKRYNALDAAIKEIEYARGEERRAAAGW